jgi:hypothetical protein
MAWCNDTTGNLNNSETRWVYINFTSYLPNATEFPVGFGTTNFSLVADLTDVTNMVLAGEDAWIMWNNSVNSRQEDYDTNIEFGLRFVSVNSSALNSTINSSANISMKNVPCNATIYSGSDAYSSPSEIINLGNLCNSTTEPNCTNIVCSAGVLNFTVNHFTGYAAAGNTNLTI